jgi:hypothetical protein
MPDFTSLVPLPQVIPWLDDVFDTRLNGPLWDAFSLAFVLGKIPVVGDVVTAVDLATVFTDGDATGWDKFFAIAGTGIDGLAGDLRQSGNMTGYLSGVALSQVWDVFEKGRTMDLSPEQLSRNFEFITTDPWGAVSGAAEGIVNYIPDLIDNFWPF